MGSERSRIGTEKGLLARGYTYKIRPKVIHVTVLKYYNARSRVFQQGDAGLLYASVACCIFRKQLSLVSLPNTKLQ